MESALESETLNLWRYYKRKIRFIEHFTFSKYSNIIYVNIYNNPRRNIFR